MPMLFVSTNLSPDKLPSDANASLTEVVSLQLNKPKNYIFVSIQHVPTLSFQGTLDTAALVELKSIGFPSGGKKKVVQEVTNYLHQKFGIPQDRVGMTLVDLSPDNVGIGGSTFA